MWVHARSCSSDHGRLQAIRRSQTNHPSTCVRCGAPYTTCRLPSSGHPRAPDVAWALGQSVVAHPLPSACGVGHSSIVTQIGDNHVDDDVNDPESRCVAVLGMGEAGCAIAQDLCAAGVVVRGYDPRSAQLTGVPVGVLVCSSEAEAVSGASVVLSLNSAHDAMTALRNATAGLGEGVLWADLNTGSARLKRELAAALSEAVGDATKFADVALMAPVAGRGIRTPMMVGGPGASAYAEAMAPWGAEVEVLGEEPGEAATRKLLRSVFYKGLAAAVLEAMTAARAAGLETWLHEHIAEELDRSDRATVDHLLRGSVTHAERRSHEMAAAVELLADLQVPAHLTAASRDVLADLAHADRKAHR